MSTEEPVSTPPVEAEEVEEPQEEGNDEAESIEDAGNSESGVILDEFGDPLNFPTLTNKFARWLLIKRAPMDFKRVRVPTPAVALHLCIGSVYAWSVLGDALVSENEDWPRGFFTPESLAFSLAIFFLGFSAAFAGRWVERFGPRATSMLAGVFFGLGNIVGGIGALMHNYIILVVGYGCIGGIGLGIAYVSPVSTLIKWFPDRRGFATGLAVMGFGGGAAIASQVYSLFLNFTTVGWVMITMGCVYFSVMVSCGALLRIPQVTWKPLGWDPEIARKTTKLKVVSGPVLSLRQAMHTYQFYFMWLILFINVSAGISILSVAKTLMKKTFGKSNQETVNMVMFISIFNMAGRFIWAFISDYIGRQVTFFIFAVVQAILFGLMATLVENQEWTLFVISIFIIYSMYGGGFSCIPAFLADMFGVRNVGAVHGVTLTAWAMAGVIGPTLITVSVQVQKDRGADTKSQYNLAFYIISGMLCVMAILVSTVRSVGKANIIELFLNKLFNVPIKPTRWAALFVSETGKDEDDEEGTPEDENAIEMEAIDSPKGSADDVDGEGKNMDDQHVKDENIEETRDDDNDENDGPAISSDEIVAEENENGCESHIEESPAQEEEEKKEDSPEEVEAKST
jgi:MFS family permease